MLQPSLVTAAVIANLQSIAPLVVQMNGNSANIYAHNFDFGDEVSLANALAELKSPGILVAYKRILGGNFDQGTMWKHQMEWYISPMNMAQPSPANPAPLGTMDVAWLVMNGVVGLDRATPQRNIRQITMLGGKLLLMDVPTLIRKLSTEQNDWFCWDVSFPEYGDN